MNIRTQDNAVGIFNMNEMLEVHTYFYKLISNIFMCVIIIKNKYDYQIYLKSPYQ